MESERLIWARVGANGKLYLATEDGDVVVKMGEKYEVLATNSLPDLKCAADLGRNDLELSSEAERALQGYAWPGNIRELRNVIERAALLSERRILLAADLRFDNAGKRETPVNDSQLSLLELERRHIELALAEERGNVELAAMRLGIPRCSLYQKIRKFQITSSKV